MISDSGPRRSSGEKQGLESVPPGHRKPWVGGPGVPDSGLSCPHSTREVWCCESHPEYSRWFADNLNPACVCGGRSGPTTWTLGALARGPDRAEESRLTEQGDAKGLTQVQLCQAAAGALGPRGRHRGGGPPPHRLSQQSKDYGPEGLPRQGRQASWLQRKGLGARDGPGPGCHIRVPALLCEAGRLFTLSVPSVSPSVKEQVTLPRWLQGS